MESSLLSSLLLPSSSTSLSSFLFSNFLSNIFILGSFLYLDLGILTVFLNRKKNLRSPLSRKIGNLLSRTKKGSVGYALTVFVASLQCWRRLWVAGNELGDSAAGWEEASFADTDEFTLPDRAFVVSIWRASPTSKDVTICWRSSPNPQSFPLCAKLGAKTRSITHKRNFFQKNRLKIVRRNTASPHQPTNFPKNQNQNKKRKKAGNDTFGPVTSIPLICKLPLKRVRISTDVI